MSLLPLYLVQTLPQVSSQLEMKLSPHVVEAPASNLGTKQLELVRNLVERSSETGKPLPSLQVFLADFEAWLKTLAENNPLRKSIEEISAWTEHNNDPFKEATRDIDFVKNNKNNLRGANLSQADLTGANLEGANLAGANLEGANCKGANLSGANLTGADCKGANLRGANLERAVLAGANLFQANLRGAILTGADLSKANLREAILRCANLREAILTGADLSKANLREAFLRGAKLQGANLAKANLQEANLTKAYLWQADLTGANLIGANLLGADLTGTKLDYKGIRQLRIFKEFTKEIPDLQSDTDLCQYLSSLIPEEEGFTVKFILPRSKTVNIPNTHVHYYIFKRTSNKTLEISFDDNEIPSKSRSDSYFAHLKLAFNLNLESGQLIPIPSSCYIENFSGKGGSGDLAEATTSRIIEEGNVFKDLKQVIQGTSYPGQGSSIAVYEGKKRLSITYPAHIPSTAPDEKVREWADLQGIVLI